MLFHYERSTGEQDLKQYDATLVARRVPKAAKKDASLTSEMTDSAGMRDQGHASFHLPGGSSILENLERHLLALHENR